MGDIAIMVSHSCGDHGIWFTVRTRNQNAVQDFTNNILGMAKLGGMQLKMMSQNVTCVGISYEWWGMMFGKVSAMNFCPTPSDDGQRQIIPPKVWSMINFLWFLLPVITTSGPWWWWTFWHVLVLTLLWAPTSKLGEGGMTIRGQTNTHHPSRADWCKKLWN